MGLLEKPVEKCGVPVSHFPDPFLAVIWRNWGQVDPDRISKALEASPEEVRACAALMGLNPEEKADPVWMERGYLSIIRNNWHLLEYDQIMTLLDVNEEELAFILKEDDFMWHKMGEMKPSVLRPRYRPLSDAEKKQAARIPCILREMAGELCSVAENAFDFLAEFYSSLKGEGRKDLVFTNQDSSIRYVYSYFAVYGDPLLNPEIDPYPEGLLEKYAQYGINGIWLQGILYQLAPYPFEPALSKDWEKRVASLNRLVARAKKYGIGVYLYLNEPRCQDEAFFARHPELRGADYNGFSCLCTSRPEVQDYLREAAFHLFQSVPDLAGFFTITMSENLTNCFSKSPHASACPLCAARGPEVVVPEVSNLLTQGARQAKPDVKSICWTWAWRDWAQEAVKNLSQGQIVMSNSEEAMPTHIAGVEGEVADYTMSIPGPGEKAKGIWSAAREKGMEIAAKVQFNNTWELSAVPYIPVFDLVGEHINHLKAQGVRHLQLSWTLGGYPSPNLKMAAQFLQHEGPGSVSDFIRAFYGPELAPVVDQAQKQLCSAFREFPFHIGVLYVAPQNYGPKSLFYTEPTGFHASMIGFPYDDLEGWRSIYPQEVFENQFRRLCKGWKAGLDILSAHPSENPLYCELTDIARVSYCHFASVYNQIRFVRTRDALAAAPGDGDLLEQMGQILQAEKELVLELMTLRARDSRFGFEASNHYYYTQQDLKEKLLNLRYCMEHYGLE